MIVHASYIRCMLSREQGIYRESYYRVSSRNGQSSSIYSALYVIMNTFFPRPSKKWLRWRCAEDLAIRASYFSRLSRRLSVLGEDFTGRARKSGCSWQREEARWNGPIYIRCRRREARFTRIKTGVAFLRAVCAVVHGRMKSGRMSNCIKMYSFRRIDGLTRDWR